MRKQFTAYAYNGNDFIRFVNNLACATGCSQQAALKKIQVETVRVPLRGAKTVIKYHLDVAARKQQQNYFKSIDHEFFVWPSERVVSRFPP